MTPFASLADEPPAIHAPAPAREAPASSAPASAAPAIEPGWISARALLALGGGSSGIAGVFGAEVDVWPVRWLGVGLEGIRGGSGGVAIVEPVASDEFRAERLRLSARFRLRGGGFATLTLAGGRGRQTVNSLRCSIPDCEAYPDEGYGPYPVGKSGSGASGAIEAGIYVRAEMLQLGFVGRGDITGPVQTLTFGPVLGLEF